MKYTKKDLEEALLAIASMISRGDRVIVKFTEGTSQHTLQKNRLRALNIASSLISRELSPNDVINEYTKEDLEKSLAPIASLISKSEKAQQKLTPNTWQYTMLGSNLKALYIASPLLIKELNK